MFEQNVVAENFFLKDVWALRQNAQVFINTTSSVEHRRRDQEATVEILQTVLAAEIVCVLRYTMISVSQDGLRNPWIGAEFQEQANDERKHMKMAAERIQQLGGKPNFNPDRLASRIAALNDCDGNFAQRVKENLVAEQSIIQHYHELIAYFGESDPATCAMLRDIVYDEEDHTRDMEDLLATYTG